MKKNLDQWLAFLESNHPTEIDMGLERVQTVAQRLNLLKPAPLTLLVAGTNGKGSTVTMCSSILNVTGMNVGSYMSPHLHVYNERVRINGQPVADELIIESFEKIDEARAEISLTYFEVGTLSALYIFKKAKVDAAVLEIGLGGRLDAVNIVEPNGAAVTSIGLDHQDWLGSDINSIAYEKAGVYRAFQPAICGERNPPSRLIEHAKSLDANLLIKGRDFDFKRTGDKWSWQGVAADGQALNFVDLTLPALPIENACTALQLLIQVCPMLTLDEINLGLQNAQLGGRLQQFAYPYSGILDVGHNPQAAKLLNEHLVSQPIKGKRYALLAMLKDKDALAVAQSMPGIDKWYLAGLDGYRGQTCHELGNKVSGVIEVSGKYETVADGLDGLKDIITNQDQVIVFGSFLTVAAAQQWLDTLGAQLQSNAEVEG
ncbi:bifunctional tetrahydrofolate synthase/dihydrofolate synthase [Bermanella sp. WJH001]|uniref:bifunctional tetrahydrofolate synthase/dihydrofolate synthase n=1 Tax=Bermanella sp. WJH001 TaxID=3048005 RepID=UPI0024BDCF49|nr:bifunctional tetrahydrofolate synthase/dihydrofolate synthase [Bermanella sp. WJH001]MDJ1536912.1 bifunctional tetrahydrofolate synthase/dihydrofolate synthase [Bermanella sp. WJH001]